MEKINICPYCHKKIKPNTGGFFETKTIDHISYYDVEYHQKCYNKIFFN